MLEITPAAKPGKPKPKIIREIQRRLDRAYSNPRILPTLTRAVRRSETSHDMRSELRQACILTLKVMLEHMDILTQRVGRPGDIEWQGITMAHIAQRAGLSLRRAERAMAALKDAMLVNVYPIAKARADQPGEFYGLAAIRRIADPLFGLLNMAAALVAEKAKAYKRQGPRTQRQKSRADLAAMRAKREFETWHPGSGRSGAQALRELSRATNPDPGGAMA